MEIFICIVTKYNGNIYGFNQFTFYIPIFGNKSSKKSPRKVLNQILSYLSYIIFQQYVWLNLKYFSACCIPFCKIWNQNQQIQLRLCKLGPGTVLTPLQYTCKIYPSRLYEKLRLFCLCALWQCRVYYIYHVEFHFRFGHHQLSR